MAPQPVLEGRRLRLGPPGLPQAAEDLLVHAHLMALLLPVVGVGRIRRRPAAAALGRVLYRHSRIQTPKKTQSPRERKIKSRPPQCDPCSCEASAPPAPDGSRPRSPMIHVGRSDRQSEKGCVQQGRLDRLKLRGNGHSTRFLAMAPELDDVASEVGEAADGEHAIVGFLAERRELRGRKSGFWRGGDATAVGRCGKYSLDSRRNL
ncbi:hypothetical protein GW17_00023688 [Ensete ventricosum]|nr:hypothetical protein GW17_00023688 [Ensete ventricosum]